MADQETIDMRERVSKKRKKEMRAMPKIWNTDIDMKERRKRKTEMAAIPKMCKTHYVFTIL